LRQNYQSTLEEIFSQGNWEGRGTLEWHHFISRHAPRRGSNRSSKEVAHQRGRPERKEGEIYPYYLKSSAGIFRIFPSSLEKIITWKEEIAREGILLHRRKLCFLEGKSAFGEGQITSNRRRFNKGEGDLKIQNIPKGGSLKS